ncbi:hypothetical protein MMC28_001212 [Mycoblastus sanguinarius]|nr:hypothetical protein [Mycoblastus sanguinarius]
MLPRIDHELVRQNDDARGAVSLTDIFEIETAITGLALYLTSNVYFSFVFFHDIMAQMEDPEATMEAALASRYRPLRRLQYHTAQWHQWLRGTRPSPPSLQEQQHDVLRQQQLKQLAQAADERWAAKPSVLDKPKRGNLELGVGDGEMQGTVGKKWEEGQKTEAGEEKEKERSEGQKKERENPWKRDRGSAGEGFQPEAWTPGPVRR